MAWIKMLGTAHIEIRGKPVTLHRGDWVDVGRHIALRFVSDGLAEFPEKEPLGQLRGMGVILLGQLPAPILPKDLPTDGGPPRVPWPKTLIWNPSRAFDPKMLAVGAHLLERWQMAVPLDSYDLLAKDFGSEAERKATQELIHDLRVPVFDTGLIWVRRCAAARAVIEDWVREREEGDDHLAFLRAVYRHKPLLCTLPVEWGK